MNSRTSSLGLAIVSLLSTAAQAEQIPVPRAHDIKPMAASCGIGPFPQLGKAGQYNPHCTTLTDAEKCLALIKGHMSSEGVMRSVGDSEEWAERANYCVEHFRKQLLGE